MSDLEPTALACLERTRSAVLNILVAVGVGIAVSGWLLRWRDRGAVPRPTQAPGDAWAPARSWWSPATCAAGSGPAGRHRATRPTVRAVLPAHVLAALVGALAIPLGLVYGWTVRPRLDAVAPFWVAGLRLGLLALPRALELEGFESRLPEPGPSEPQA